MSNLREIFEAMHAAHGKLTPDLVVQEAVDPAHPLHSRFEWNDAVAAHEHRLAQASNLIRSVKVTYGTDSAGSSKKIRAFWPVKADEEEGTRTSYEPVEDILSDEVSRQLLLRQLERDWRRFKARYGGLKEFAGLLSREMEEQG